MREIKFRAWDKKRKEWYRESDPSSPTYYGFHIWGECTMLAAPHLDDLQYLEVTQYIGLKDSNDKEIYEGDILRINDEPDSNVDSVDDITNIGYLKGFIGRGRPVEIIGNVHENRELLR